MNRIDDQELSHLNRCLHGLGLAVTLVIVVAAWLAIYRPLESRREACAKEAQTFTRELQQVDAVRAEHARLKAEFADLKRLDDLLHTRVPEEPREAEFLAQLSQLAGETGLHIEDYRPGTVTRHEAYSSLRIDLMCAGDYASLCRFLDGLAALPRATTVATLDIDAAEQVSYTARISLDLCFAANPRTQVAKRG